LEGRRVGGALARQRFGLAAAHLQGALAAGIVGLGLRLALGVLGGLEVGVVIVGSVAFIGLEIAARLVGELARGLGGLCVRAPTLPPGLRRHGGAVACAGVAARRTRTAARRSGSLAGWGWPPGRRLRPRQSHRRSAASFRRRGRDDLLGGVAGGGVSAVAPRG